MTTQEHVEVICDTKTILTRFSRKDTAASQPAGWQDTWQEKLSAIYCGDPATREIIGGGWTLGREHDLRRRRRLRDQGRVRVRRGSGP